MIGSRLEQLTLVREWSECPALLGTCLYGAVANSFLTDEEKDAVGEIDATNEVERVGCAAALGLKTTLGLTQGEIVAAIRGVGEIGRVDVENVENGREGLESAAGETRRGTVLGRIMGASPVCQMGSVP